MVLMVLMMLNMSDDDDDVDDVDDGDDVDKVPVDGTPVELWKVETTEVEPKTNGNQFNCKVMKKADWYEENQPWPHIAQVMVPGKEEKCKGKTQFLRAAVSHRSNPQPRRSNHVCNFNTHCQSLMNMKFDSTFDGSHLQPHKRPAQ